ncbi:MAG: Bax inhibitor-1/YccA family protein [Rickettsia sp.]|nr:Bax inhibitor-1/YccA family protein [Rickettsia sp.]
MIDYTKDVSKSQSQYEEGLRSYMLRIYNYMAAALCVSGIMGVLALTFSPLTNLLYQINSAGQITTSPVGMIVFLAPLGISIYFMFNIGKIQLKTAQTLFWVYASLMGLSLSYIGFVYSLHSILRTFFITASVFAATSIYGHQTKKDLTNLGSFLMMGLIGIIIASLVNMFFKSSALDFAVSFIGVFIFIGLIAWDTQKLKQIYRAYANTSAEMGEKMAIVGAFTLYLDFINLFLHLLRFFGTSKNNN